MNRIAFVLITLLCSVCTAQAQNLSGHVFSTENKPIEFATVALLQPADSTLAYFGITDANGAFEMKSVKAGSYRLQISFIGYETFDTLYAAGSASTYMGVYMLRPATIGLDAVQVTAERIPIQILGDTLQYNANSFKTAPDAAAEELLKKLPGVEVDASGNIKAQGEDVQQVLVDGKEFFSSDPTVATKNLPADAIEKVQVYDKTSDDADFTGVDDGQRSKTINLVLKDGKKSMWLGNVQGGYGTDNRYQGSGKLYRFTKTNQIAALCMINNVNDFGFSINDYIDFSGGIGNMMRGGGFKVSSDGDVPVNFGQSVDGAITSGAGGLNYTYEPDDDHRFNVSYMGNGYLRDLQQYTSTQQFSTLTDFNTLDTLNETAEKYFNRLNFNIKTKPDSMQSIIVNGNASLNLGYVTSSGFTANYFEDSLSNTLQSAAYTTGNNMDGTVAASYIRKTNTKWKYVKFKLNASGGTSIDDETWQNITTYLSDGLTIMDNTDRNDKAYDWSGALALSGMYQLGKGYYLEPSVVVKRSAESLVRMQGLTDAEGIIDSLSPDLLRNNSVLRPTLALKKNTESTQIRWELGVEALQMAFSANDFSIDPKTYYFLLPQFMVEHEVKRGLRFGIEYNAEVNAPTVSQLNPVTDYSNSLSLFTGNPYLTPEYIHNAQLRFMFFDQFSFTSLFARLSGTYTQDKINYSKTINEDLSQSYTLINVDDDYSGSLGLHFNTPIRPIKMNFGVSVDESYDRGINFVNGEENVISSWTHGGEISFDNRKKDIIDFRFGGSLSYTASQYSVATGQNADYINQGLFSEISITPDSLWRIEADGEMQAYRLIGSDETTVIPFVNAQISRYILKNNRGTITLKAYDILDQNKGITQTAAYNYIQVQESNTIGRYFMLSFKYRINKQDQNTGIDVRIN
jgi:hypothetical protein